MRIHLFYFAVLIGLSAIAIHLYKSRSDEGVYRQELETIEHHIEAAEKANDDMRVLVYDIIIRDERSFYGENLLSNIVKADDTVIRGIDSALLEMESNKSELSKARLEKIAAAVQSYQNECWIIRDSLSKKNKYPLFDTKTNRMIEENDELSKLSNKTGLFSFQKYRQNTLLLLSLKAHILTCTHSVINYLCLFLDHRGGCVLEWFKPRMFTNCRKIKLGETFIAYFEMDGVSSKFFYFQTPHYTLKINGKNIPFKDGTRIWSEKPDKVGIHTIRTRFSLINPYTNEVFFDRKFSFTYEVVP
jgi:hypothetical protein